MEQLPTIKQSLRQIRDTISVGGMPHDAVERLLLDTLKEYQKDDGFRKHLADYDEFFKSWDGKSIPVLGD
jgi:hypothetical protein